MLNLPGFEIQPSGAAIIWPTTPPALTKKPCSNAPVASFSAKATRSCPPMLMMDRITDVSADGGAHGKGHITAEFDITPDLWFFDCHFPGNPIMPGCLGLDGLWQLTGFNLGWRGWQGRGYALGVGEVKLTGMVRPDRKMLSYKIDFTKAIQTRRLTMGVADGIVEADGEVIYQVKDMKVALSES